MEKNKIMRLIACNCVKIDYRMIILSLILLIMLPSINGRKFEEPTNITGLADFAEWTNRVTESYYGISIIIVTFFVSFILLKGFESNQAFAGCLFLTAVVAIGLNVFGILNMTWTIGAVILCALSGLLLLWFS